MAENSGSSAGMGMVVGALVVIVAIIAVFMFAGGGDLFGGGGSKSVDVKVEAPELPTPSK